MTVIKAKIQQDIISAMEESSAGTKGYDTVATVKRVEDNTAWVHIPGGVDETPVTLSIDAKSGDIVRIRVAGGKAWHCGGGLQDTGSAMNGGNRGATLHGICTNSNSIGIELCCYRHNGIVTPTPESIKTAAPLVRHLMKKYGIPAGRVVRHFDVTGKCCPNGYISAKAWAGLHERLTGVKDVPYPVSDMKKGSTCDQVVKLQKCLNKIIVSDLDIDGEFGPATEKAVRSFQKKYKLEVDGIVGPKTRAKIKKLYVN